MDNLKLDCQTVSEILNHFLIQETRKADFENVILGLSGGIDSSSIVALMSKLSDNVKTFSIGFEGANDESSFFEMWITASPSFGPRATTARW